MRANQRSHRCRWRAVAGALAQTGVHIGDRHDPYGCDDRQGRSMFERLGGTQIVRDDGGFGDYDQAYETFELLDRLIGQGHGDRLR